MAYSYTNKKGITFYLHKTQVTFRRNNIQKIVYFFAKNIRDKAIDYLPDGFVIIEDEGNNMSLLKRKDRDLLTRLKNFSQ